MRKRSLGALLSTALIAGAITALPVAAAHADTAATVTVGPEQLLTGSTGITLTKEYETVAPLVAGYRSSADAAYVTAPDASTALQLSTGAGKSNPNPYPAVPQATLHGKVYVGRNFPANTPATAITAFGYSTYSFDVADPAPYLSVEFYNASNSSGHQYLNLVWTPTSASGWTDWDTTGATWKTNSGAAQNLGIKGTFVTLAAAVAAISDTSKYSGGDTPLLLVGAHVSFGDTAGNYAGKFALLRNLSLNLNGTATTYQFTAPYGTTCAAPTSGPVTTATLADPSQWQVRTEYQPTVVSTATATMGVGPLGAPSGGSLTMASGAGTGTNTAPSRGHAGKIFVDRQLPGCTVGDLTDLSYRTYTASGQGGLAPYLNIEVNLPATPTAAAQTAILVWSPGEDVNPQPAIDAWSSWTPLVTGTWRMVGSIGTLTTGLHYSWSAIAAAIPTANVQRGIEIVVGDSSFQTVPGAGWAGKSLQVGDLNVSINGTASAAPFTYTLGNCPVTLNDVTQTMTLTADCSTAVSLPVPDGWTLDGAGYTITATETPTTVFTGAVLQNAGASMNVVNLHVTTSGWDNSLGNSGNNLAGIRFKNAAGSISSVTINGISHGSGVQEGNALDIDNFGGASQLAVTADHVTVTNYQKTGIRANGNVKLTLTNSTVGVAGGPTGAPEDLITAANSLQVSRTADADITGNHLTGNDWDGDTVWSASDVLFYQAGKVTFSRNVLDGAGTDFGVVSDTSKNVVVSCNLISRTADVDGGTDVWNTGISSSTDTFFAATDNTITGFGTPTDGVLNIVNQGGCAPAAPVVTASAITTTSATITWVPGAAQPYAPTSGWQLTGPTGSLDFPAAGATTTLTGLVPGTSYAVTVRGVNVSGQGTSGGATFATLAAPAPPAAVSGLTATAVGPTSVTLTWNPAARATSYDVLVGSTAVTVTGPTAVVSGLTPSTTYVAKVTPTNAVGAGPSQSTVIGTPARPPVLRTSTMIATPKPVRYGQRVLLRGLVRLNGIGLSGQPVTVFQVSGRAWVRVGVVRTGADGRWALAYRPAKSTTARAVVTGYPQPRVLITVTRAVGLTGTSRGGIRTLSGLVGPRVTKGLVRIEIRSGATWKLVTTTRLSRRSTFSVKLATGGVYRAIAPAGGGYARGVSGLVRLR